MNHKPNTDMETNNAIASMPAFIEKSELLKHWQGHRGLSRRVIEAFPEEQLFSFSIGGMRTFANLAMEMIVIAASGTNGLAFNDWTFKEPELTFESQAPGTKEELLKLWDLITDHINATWEHISLERFHEVASGWGMYEMPVYAHLLYFIENEVHHRGQGYVYLRALGIEPPAFWDRF